jgi:hypothetical protein
MFRIMMKGCGRDDGHRDNVIWGGKLVELGTLSSRFDLRAVAQRAGVSSACSGTAGQRTASSEQREHPEHPEHPAAEGERGKRGHGLEAVAWEQS